MNRILGLTLVVCLLCSLTGCAVRDRASVSAEVVTGVTFYPVDDALLVRIADVSANPARLLAQSESTMIPPLGAAPGTTPPRTFNIVYDRSEVVTAHRYLIWAEVLEKGDIVAASESAPVITDGGTTTGVSLRVVPVSALSTLPPTPR